MWLRWKRSRLNKPRLSRDKFESAPSFSLGALSFTYAEHPGGQLSKGVTVLETEYIYINRCAQEL